MVYLLAVAVKQQVYDEGLPGLLLTECVQSRWHEGETQCHYLQGLTTHLLILPIRLLCCICLTRKRKTKDIIQKIHIALHCLIH